ncbi:MAG: HigA family addiction module antitoxin [Armatimonadia bacterium]
MGRQPDNHLIPAEPTHPGEVLREELAARGMTQTDLASAMGRPLQTINMIVKGRKSISAETALDLEKALPGIPADFWLQLDMRYRLNVERLRRTAAGSAPAAVANA